VGGIASHANVLFGAQGAGASLVLRLQLRKQSQSPPGRPFESREPCTNNGKEERR